MEKIKFLQKNDSECSIAFATRILQLNDNLIKIVFKDEIPSDEICCNGFEVLNDKTDENISEDYYYKFTTIYRKNADEMSILLSSDGRVYVEPETPEFTPSEPYVPTLEDIKKAKINSFSAICSKSIVDGVNVQINNTTEHFSYTEEDQVNLKEIFDLAIQTNVPMYYHADGEGCKLYTVEQIIAIYTSATTNKMHHTTYFNQMRMYINSLEKTEEVNTVEYGQELTDEYLHTYNESMAQAKLVLEALLAKRAAVLAEG